MIRIRPQREADPAAVELLLDKSFGPDRSKKTVYRLREGVPPLPELCFAAFDGRELRGSLQFWPIQVRPLRSDGAPVPALLLGPLAVDPDYAGRGIGVGLMRVGLQKAAAQGHRIVILVGDLPYYARVGFGRKGAEGLRLPGPVDPDRLLIRELVEGAATGLEGLIEKPAAEKAVADPASGATKREAAP
ncbi:N-acetyltransferase [Iodidimonas sp. SYSU 1G8]|uniref:GNAT family N-acetyltransferase n=1 Tax=Iodidimonas sp. SYSU 1G8 TaxID=3133967 RepID=UPI0031FE587D